MEPATYEIDEEAIAAVADVEEIEQPNNNNKRRRPNNNTDNNNNNNNTNTNTNTNNNTPSKTSKKPRDQTLRSCFTITPLEVGIGEQVSCNYCNAYDRKLKIFNPTKARFHLTHNCVGIDEGLRNILAATSQASRKKTREMGLPEGSNVAMGIKSESDGKVGGTRNGKNANNGVIARPLIPAPRIKHKLKDRPSSHTLILAPSNSSNIFDEEETLIITAPVEKGELIFNIVWTNAVEGVARHVMKFNAEENLEGAASTVVGYVGKKSGERDHVVMVSGQVVGDMTHEDHGLVSWSLMEEGGSKSLGERVKVMEKILKSLLVI